MKTSLAIVTSRELSSFSFYKDALYAFESILSKGYTMRIKLLNIEVL